jgi:hypothetical protein
MTASDYVDNREDEVSTIEFLDETFELESREHDSDSNDESDNEQTYNSSLTVATLLFSNLCIHVCNVSIRN